ncbi:MAG: alpha/beta hydrolase [Cyanobacteria bacterium P01_G01_bin.49]
MSLVPTALWLSVSSCLQRFNRPLIGKLSQHQAIALWEYFQTPDEPLTLEVALVLLHDYLKQLDQPLHLIGHSTSGWLGMMYDHRYHERVKSLTLLAVGTNLAVDWQAHYYAMLKCLPCDRRVILTQIVYSLFGRQSKYQTEFLISLLEQDLLLSPSPHTLVEQLVVTPEAISVPLFIGGSRDDIVVSPYQLNAWKPWLKSGDMLWEFSQGRHFFHYSDSLVVSEQITRFWQTLSGVTDTSFFLSSQS